MLTENRNILNENIWIYCTFDVEFDHFSKDTPIVRLDPFGFLLGIRRKGAQAQRISIIGDLCSERSRSAICPANSKCEVEIFRFLPHPPMVFVKKFQRRTSCNEVRIEQTFKWWTIHDQHVSINLPSFALVSVVLKRALDLIWFDWITYEELWGNTC